MLELSTGHVSETTAKWLDKAITAQGIAGALWEYGWFVYCVDENSGTDEYVYPDDLWGVMCFARKHGFYWVRFDRDGDCIDGLPTYDW